MTARLDRLGEWARRGWVLVAVAVLPWLVAPRLIQPDTKTDLTISPVRYLARALTAWNDHAGLGELQNQAYGYLFPMGPVFAIGQWLHVPAWMTQRVWWSLLLVVACAGVMRLTARLGLGTPQAGSVAGLAYALSARILTVLANNSIEAWPMAVAPWLVVAAVGLIDPAATRRQKLHAAAATGLLTTALGGVNAVASGTVLVLPALFLLTHSTGRRRLGWWAGGALLGALWWLIPLLVLGRYGYPFLDFIETSSLTTAVTSAPNTLRGANDWVAFILDAENHPVWQSGWVLAQTVVAILATCAVAAVGIIGIFRLRGHLARWALLSVLIGALAMVVGHDGVVGSPIAGPVRELLDGPLAPLRNVHKADPLLRLPLCLGVAVVWTAWQRCGHRRIALRRFGIGALVLVAATPVWVGRLGDAAAYEAIPASWQQAAAAVDAAADHDGGSTLVLPAARTAQFVWGKTTDEPLSALATSPIVTRAAAPLGHPGATRLLDRIDQLAASGVSQPDLAQTLTRMGITRVLVRHDVATAARALPANRVETTLARSTGFQRTGSYGTGDERIDLWDVTTPAPTSYTGAIRVAGSPESVTDLLGTGLLGADQALLLTGEHPQVVSDTARWRAYNNGVPAQLAFTPTLPGTDTSPTRVGALDLASSNDPADHTTRVFEGFTDITATSDAADPFADGYAGPTYAPWSALDGDPATAWRTADHSGTATLAFRIDPSVTVRQVTILLARGDGLALPQQVTLHVGDWSQSVAVDGHETLTFGVPAVTAGPISITIDSGHGDDSDQAPMGITEISIPGTHFGTALRLPGKVDITRQAVLLTRAAEDPATLKRQVQVTIGGSAPVRAWVTATAATRAGELTCGAAGSITVGNSRIPLSATFTSQQITDGEPVEAKPCGDGSSAEIPTGTVAVEASGGSGALVQQVVLGANPSASAGHYLVTHQGANAGWQAQAQASGRSLTAVTLDGWQQGFVLPAGVEARDVTVTFAPNTAHRIGLAIGALAVLALLVLWGCTRGPRPGRVSCSGEGEESTPEPVGSGSSVPVRSRMPAVALSALVVAVLASGLWGVAAAAVALAVPARYRGQAAAGALVLSGVLLSAFGVVDRYSFGAISGQLVSTVTLALLAARWATGDAPSAATVAPPSTPRPRPPAV
ncbi:arabinofuranan 3-O-arabinosyltransferase [Branchiibius hedensis]|uniref:Arabinofuranan 3-O-arabinosyltransferase n=1 Tax=Branchiibius hedensis TaxID=672460 RepID=A0A2Y8ZQF9_9MICO|nr:arabinofuranan 3-O-arabinosyltransferase [Branchiibius hedensis]SSA34084.1 arabinofuranan 3-O-arabinosyltransferase [Branchiibius hedensis]